MTALAEQMLLALPDVDAPSGEEWQGSCPEPFVRSWRRRVGLYEFTVARPKGQGYAVACVSARMCQPVRAHRWYPDRHGYLRTRIGRKWVYLHKFVFGDVPAPLVLDHIDRNPLNCCDDNLRAVTRAENSVNSRRPRNARPASSRFRGVTAFFLANRRRVWQAGITRDGKFYHGKLHTSEVAAARAFNKLARKIWPTMYPQIRNRIPVLRRSTRIWESVIAQPITQPTPHRKAA